MKNMNICMIKSKLLKEIQSFSLINLNTYGVFKCNALYWQVIDLINMKTFRIFTLPNLFEPELPANVRNAKSKSDLNVLKLLLYWLCSNISFEICCRFIPIVTCWYDSNWSNSMMNSIWSNNDHYDQFMKTI